MFDELTLLSDGASGVRPAAGLSSSLTGWLDQAAERIWAARERARAGAALHDSEEKLAADLANAERLRSLAERLVSEDRFDAIYDEVLTVANIRPERER